jgi:hypothetical protein
MSEALDPLPLLRALYERGIEHIVVGGFAVSAHGRVCGLDHLRAIKRAAGRPRDLEDLKGLGER